MYNFIEEMNTVKASKCNRIYTDDLFLTAIGCYLHKKQSRTDNINFLTEKKYRIKDTDSTYRVINHWSSLGLLDDTRLSDNKGWRKFSLVDLVWLKVLMQLRQFGVPLEKIKIGYQAITEKAEIFECGVALCMMRKSINLIFFSDGHIEIIPRRALTVSESMGTFKEATYLVVSLNRCLEQIFPGRSYLPPLDMFELSTKEISILSALRSGEYDEITIQLKNGDFERIDTKKGHIGEAEKLADILSKFSYGDLTIKKQAGKIVFSEVVTKEKL